jgi:phosphatidylserine/phosphatidylglycerophosphate/cardiolipin synthase-like enzyme
MENKTKEKNKTAYLSAENVSARYVYIGTHAGNYIENSMKDAKKSIKIVSPYLDEKLVREVLKEKALAGVAISIITSASKESLKLAWHKNALMSLYPQHDKDKPFGKYLFIKDDDFVHAKFYIIDDEIAYLTSVNFTTKGINENYELSVAFEEQEFVKKICGYFEQLFNKGFSSYEDKELSELLYPAKARQ